MTFGAARQDNILCTTSGARSSWSGPEWQVCTQHYRFVVTERRVAVKNDYCFVEISRPVAHLIIP